MGVRPVAFRIIAGGASPEHSSMGQPDKSRLTSSTHAAAKAPAGCGCGY